MLIVKNSNRGLVMADMMSLSLLQIVSHYNIFGRMLLTDGDT